MPQWEYKILDSTDVASRGNLKGKDRADLEAYLNAPGKEGWEVINLDFKELDSRFEFSGVAKRPIHT